MNDEINIKMGADLSGLAAGLRGMKSMVADAGKSMKDSFKDAFSGLMAPLSIAGLTAGAIGAVRSLMEDVKNIKRISESTGMSTGMVQDMLNLGKASGVASDQIESMMDKFVKGLAPGTDPETALMNIADKMEKLTDPTERSRLAMENFGKSGAKLIPILMQGSEGVRKLAADYGHLTDVEIDQLEHANQVLEKKGQQTKVKMAQLIEGAGMTAQAFNKTPWWKKVLEGPLAPLFAIRKATKGAATPDQSELDADNARTQQQSDNAKKAIQEQKEAAIAAAKELSDKEAYINAAPQEKVLMLTRQILATRREMLLENDDKKRIKDLDKIAEIEEKRKTIQDEIARSQKEADEKKKQHLEEEKKLTEEIHNARDKIDKLGRERSAEQRAPYLPTLEELATSGRAYVSGSTYRWGQGPFAGMARELLNLQADAKQSLIYGNQGRFQNDVSRIDQLKQALSQMGVMAADDRLKNIDEQTAETNTHLSDLLSKATGDGINVKGPE